MTIVSGAGGTQQAVDDPVPSVGNDYGLITAAVAAALAGGGLLLAARTSGVALLVAVAVLQFVLAVTWVWGTSVPGPRGATVVAVLAAAGADVAVSIFPNGRLGPLLVVVGLAVPVMFVHQLLRGAARTQVTSSLSAVAVAVLAVVGAAAFLQLRTAIARPSTAEDVVGTAVAAIAGALVVGALIDLLAPVPRVDRDVARGVLGVLGSAAVGAALGYLLLETDPGYGGSAGPIVGGALGLLAGMLALGASFTLHSTPDRPGWRHRIRPVVAALLPLGLLAPVAFLALLAVRT